MPAKIILVKKGLTEANSLAYNSTELITTVKSFVILVSEKVIQNLLTLTLMEGEPYHERDHHVSGHLFPVKAPKVLF